MTRKYATQLLGMIEEGLLNKDDVIMACIKHMSEDEVKDMMHVNEFLIEEDKSEDA